MVRGNAGEGPDLAFIEERWPSLPEHIKAAVLALVRSVDGQGQS